MRKGECAGCRLGHLKIPVFVPVLIKLNNIVGIQEIISEIQSDYNYFRAKFECASAHQVQILNWAVSAEAHVINDLAARSSEYRGPRTRAPAPLFHRSSSLLCTQYPLAADGWYCETPIRRAPPV